MRKLIHGERGQAIVETALVLPVVVLILFGILDAGRIFNAWIVVTNGAREGARVAATGRAEPEILDQVDLAMGGLATYDVVVANAVGPSGDPVTVTVGTDVTMVTPLISSFFGALVRIENSAVMRLE